MEKALEIINSNKIYIEIFKNVMKKYKQYSKITGYFNINPKNNEEMDILASFDTNVYNNKKLNKCNLKQGFVSIGARPCFFCICETLKRCV